MGYSISVTRGFGFAVPYEVQARIEAEHAKDPEWDGFGEYLYELIANEPLLAYASAWFMDYSPADNEEPAYAVLVKSTYTRQYNIGVFPAQEPRIMPRAEEFNALRRIWDALGIEEPDYKHLTVVSYG